MLHFARFVIAFLSAALLAGCGSPMRTFNPETDTGYQVTAEEKEGYYTFEDAFDDASSFGRDTALPFLAGAATAVFPPAAIAGGLGIGKIVESRMEVAQALCQERICSSRHHPYGDILYSGNVMRGIIQLSISDEESAKLVSCRGIVEVPEDDEKYPDYIYVKNLCSNRVFKQPEGFAAIQYPVQSFYTGALYDDKKVAPEAGYLVDVYFPHMPELERDAIRNGQIYDGMVIHVVCEAGDGGCLKKYQKGEDDFILGRWQTLEAYLADYEANDGFPN